MKTERCDVLVIGGGPAGSTVAALIKKYAPERRVVILERAPGPRHHVGESLLPGMIPVLKELGVYGKIDRAGFPRKLGATYVWGRDRTPWENDFNDVNMKELIERYGGIPEKIEFAWQVRRSEYDEILLTHAAECGVEVVRGVQADGIVEDAGRVAGATGRFEDGSRTRWDAEFTADCSGQAAFLARYRPVRAYDPRLKNVAGYAYYRGAPWMFQYTGHPDKTKILICSSPAGWFWYIPLDKDLVSVGFVTTVERLKQDGGDLRALFDRELAACGEIAPSLAKAERVMDIDGEGRDFFTHSDWSYLPVESSGPGWVACGDAAVFVDPILSSGVTLAHLSGHRAAYSILEHWRRGTAAERDLLWADYGAYCRDVAGQYLALALFWYGNDPNAEEWWIQARKLQQALLPVDLADKGAFITVSAGLTQHYDRLFALKELASETATEPDEHPFYAMVMKGLDGAAPSSVFDEGAPLRLAYPFRIEYSFLPEVGAGRLRAVKRVRFLRGDPSDAVAGAFNPRKFVTRWHLSWLEAVDGRRDWSQVRAASAAAGAPAWWLDGPARLFARDLLVQGVLQAGAPEGARQ
ncbi:MAG: tryptophan 7-halogenase [Elusimicrobia bacterium]|nr:tryptophan 7-halogenase [Elusimicrobiota bacterium]